MTSEPTLTKGNTIPSRGSKLVDATSNLELELDSTSNLELELDLETSKLETKDRRERRLIASLSL